MEIPDGTDFQADHPIRDTMVLYRAPVCGDFWLRWLRPQEAYLAADGTLPRTTVRVSTRLSGIR
jgi:hypothetical protein